MYTRVKAMRERKGRISGALANCRPVCFFRGLFRDLHRVYQWLPIIWSNYDFDSIYLFILMRHKLHLMESRFRCIRTTTDWQQMSEQIHYAVLLLDRIIDDAYETNALIQHDRKWGKPQMKIDDDGCIQFWHEGVKTPHDEKHSRKEYRQAIDHAEKVRRQDIEALFQHIARHYQSWWD